MSSDLAISVQGLAKSYQIGARREGYATLRETIVDSAMAPLRRVRNLVRGGAAVPTATETLWALDGVTFDVKHGEVLGVIGRNGAGKSTLLKVLSRITTPTRGYGELRGRLGTLLEVGTGFHPELTGRENIFLNGAILGMQRAEIARKLDEIVAFAEVDTFLDTPVKHYSSGMYLRLAFGVAAHLDTEILLVDEVLAVGDAAFQKKCLGKMSGVARAGKTVLFVSHNMAAIESLCSRTIVLERGKVRFDGPVHDAVHDYLKMVTPSEAGAIDLDDFRQSSTGDGSLDAVRLLNSEGFETTTFRIGEPIVLEFALSLNNRAIDVQIGVGVNNELGVRVFTLAPRWSRTPIGETPAGGQRVHCRIEGLNLAAGQYFLRLSMGDGNRDFELFDDVPGFEIIPADLWGTGSLPRPFSQGLVLPEASWSIEPIDAASEPAEPVEAP